MTLPTEIIAGDTVEFTASSADYPASDGWTGKCKLVGTGGVTSDVTATANGADFDFTITATATTSFPAGTYTLVVWVTNVSNEKHTLSSTSVKVTVNQSSLSTATDTRSFAQKMVDEIESALYSFAQNPNVSIAIAGRSYTKQDMPTLHKLRNQYKAEVYSEKQSARIAAGLGGRKVLVRLGATS